MLKDNLKKSIVILPVLTLLFLTGCNTPDGPVGANVGSDLGGELITSVFYADMDTSLAFPSDHTGLSPHLYFGSAYGISSQFLVRFEQPATPYEWTVNSAFIELSYQGSIGGGDHPRLHFHLVDLKWSELDTFDLNELHPDMALSLLGQLSADSGKVTFPLGSAYVTDWLSWFDSSAIDPDWVDTNRTDSGISLLIFPNSTDDTERLVRFRSRSAYEDTVNTLKPRLFVYITARDSEEEELHPDTLEIIASDDIFQVDYDTTVVTDDLLVGSTVSYRSFIHFDLSSIDTSNYDIVVNRADLTLHKKPLTDPLPRTKAVMPYRLGGDSLVGFRESETKNITSSSTAIDTSLDELQLLVTVAPTIWLGGSEPNGWFFIQTGSPGMDIDRIAFHSSITDSTLRPRLTLYYTRFVR